MKKENANNNVTPIIKDCVSCVSYDNNGELGINDYKFNSPYPYLINDLRILSTMASEGHLSEDIKTKIGEQEEVTIAFRTFDTIQSIISNISNSIIKQLVYDKIIVDIADIEELSKDMFNYIINSKSVSESIAEIANIIYYLSLTEEPEIDNDTIAELRLGIDKFILSLNCSFRDSVYRYAFAKEIKLNTMIYDAIGTSMIVCHDVLISNIGWLVNSYRSMYGFEPINF